VKLKGFVVKIYSNNYQNENYKASTGLKTKGFVSPSFKSYLSMDTVILNAEQRGVSTLTRLFRIPMFFEELPDYLRIRFPNGAKIHSYASSVGAEPYSLAISVIDKFSPADAQKYLPVLARDVSKNVIQIAKSRKLPICYDEKACFESHIKRYKFEDFFQKSGKRESIYPPDRYEDEDYFVKDLLFKQVDFKKEDLFDALSSPDSFAEPSMVLFRHAWQFLDNTERGKLAQKLFSKLKSGSTVVIGDFHIEGNAREKLVDAGFQNCSSGKYGLEGVVFEKP
jgi:chemotaxis methyl-accepting protein methylase